MRPGEFRYRNQRCLAFNTGYPDTIRIVSNEPKTYLHMRGWAELVTPKMDVTGRTTVKVDGKTYAICN
jgi:hypothetical protein